MARFADAVDGGGRPTPDDDVARFNLALALIDAGRTDDAIAELEALVDASPITISAGPGSPGCSPIASSGRATPLPTPAASRRRWMPIRARCQGAGAAAPSA